MKQFIEIQRAGTIECHPAQATADQCGHVAHPLYHYEFRIGVSEPSLDCRGFLVDHNDIHQVIVSKCATVIPSCERLVLDLAHCIHNTLEDMGVRHDYVFIRISTGPFIHEGQGMKARLQFA